MNEKVDFVAIATPLVERGFRVTPVHPDTKMGVMKNWQKFQLTTIDDIRKHAEYFPHHNVGVVGSVVSIVTVFLTSMPRAWLSASSARQARQCRKAIG